MVSFAVQVIATHLGAAILLLLLLLPTPGLGCNSSSVTATHLGAATLLLLPFPGLALGLICSSSDCHRPVQRHSSSSSFSWISTWSHLQFKPPPHTWARRSSSSCSYSRTWLQFQLSHRHTPGCRHSSPSSFSWISTWSHLQFK